MTYSSLQTELKENNYAVAATDAMGVIIEANKKFLELTGYTLDELRNLAYTDITPDCWTVFENHKVIKEVFSEGSSHYQKEYITKSKQVIPIDIQVSLVENSTSTKIKMWALVKPIETLSSTYKKIKEG